MAPVEPNRPGQSRPSTRGTFRIPTVWIVMAVLTYAVLHTLFVLSTSD